MQVGGQYEDGRRVGLEEMLPKHAGYRSVAGAGIIGPSIHDGAKNWICKPSEIRPRNHNRPPA